MLPTRPILQCRDLCGASNHPRDTHLLSIIGIVSGFSHAPPRHHSFNVVTVSARCQGLGWPLGAGPGSAPSVLRHARAAGSLHQPSHRDRQLGEACEGGRLKVRSEEEGSSWKFLTQKTRNKTDTTAGVRGEVELGRAAQLKHSQGKESNWNRRHGQRLRTSHSLQPDSCSTSRTRKCRVFIHHQGSLTSVTHSF